MFLSHDKAASGHTIVLTSKKEAPKLPGFSAAEKRYVQERVKEGADIIQVFREGALQLVCTLPEAKTAPQQREATRILGSRVAVICNDLRIPEPGVSAPGESADTILAFCEGVILTNYQFGKYKTGKTKFRKNSLKKLCVDKADITAAALKELNALTEAVYFARTLVNEPLSYLTAVQYSNDMVAAGKKYGFNVTVFDEKKIRKMKMGGVLAVNKGSVQPATFNILEYKPKNAVNQKPIVLVGKGVVYDTGGLSLKPTANSMDYMKCDMGGSAVVVGAMIAIAQNKLPIHVTGLIPAVENRPGGDAFVPGDVITMYDGTTVEVMNTDAEGRLILADALAYAKSLNPQLVMDFATLTGSAARAVGPHAIALMSTANKKVMDAIHASAEKTFERYVEFPLWDEYGEMLESGVADLKNLGGASAGMITAGKFLQHFTDYPWMHLDIAPVAYNHKPVNYRGNYGTGAGVRLVYDFIKNMSKK